MENLTEYPGLQEAYQAHLAKARSWTPGSVIYTFFGAEGVTAFDWTLQLVTNDESRLMVDLALYRQADIDIWQNLKSRSQWQVKHQGDNELQAVMPLTTDNDRNVMFMAMLCRKVLHIEPGTSLLWEVSEAQPEPAAAGIPTPTEPEEAAPAEAPLATAEPSADTPVAEAPVEAPAAATAEPEPAPQPAEPQPAEPEPQPAPQSAPAPAPAPEPVKVIASEATAPPVFTPRPVTAPHPQPAQQPKPQAEAPERPHYYPRQKSKKSTLEVLLITLGICALIIIGIVGLAFFVLVSMV